MIRWGDLRAKVLRALSDTDRQKASWSDEDLLDYVNNGLRAISPHTAQEKVFAVTLSSSVTALTLPDDLIDLGAVTVSLGTRRRLLERQRLEPGQSFYQVVSSDIDDLRYWVWPSDVLNLTGTLPASSKIEIQYYGYWDQVTDVKQIIRVPGWLEEALYWYIISQANAKPAAQAAKLGQYKTRVDAGGPEDNPLIEYSEYAWRRYEAVMNSHPPQDRLIWRD